MACAAEIGGGSGKRPAAAVDSGLLGDILELAIAKIAKQVFAAAILGVFKALRHHACVFEMPEINFLRVVSTNEKVEEAIAVVVEPNCGVCIHPRWQSSLLGYAGEAVALIVMEQLRLAPFVEKKILIAVVIVVAPDRAHGDAGAVFIYIRNAHLRGDVCEGAVVIVMVERVLAADCAVGYVDVGP